MATNIDPKYFPSLETERLILRPLTENDAGFVFRHFSDPAVSRYLMDEPPPAEYAQAQEIIEIYLESEGKNHNRLGYMADTLRVVIPHGFERIGKNRIEALVYVENDPSVRLLQRLGFKQEGMLRDYFCLEGKLYDHYLFALLKGEWNV